MAYTVQIVVTPDPRRAGESTAERLARRSRVAATEARVQVFADLDRLLEWSATCEPTSRH